MPGVKAALPFLSYDRHGCISVGVDASSFLSTLHSPVVFVTVAGPTRTGKSFLANQILGRMDGFEVKPGVHASTRGVWLWPAVQHINVPTSNGSRRVSLVVLDCQGLKDDHAEDRLFCIAAALSSAVVYNALGALDEIRHEQLAGLFSDGGSSDGLATSLQAITEAIHKLHSSSPRSPLRSAGGSPPRSPRTALGGQQRQRQQQQQQQRQSRDLHSPHSVHAPHSSRPFTRSSRRPSSCCTA